MNKTVGFVGTVAPFGLMLTLLLVPAVARAQHEGHDAHKPPAAGATPTPSPSPAPSPMQMPPTMPAQGEPHAGHAHGAPTTAEPHAAEDEGLMVMSDEGMGVRVRSSRRNVMSMGAMGS